MRNGDEQPAYSHLKPMAHVSFTNIEEALI